MADEQTFITNPAKQTLKSGGPIVAFNVFEYLRPAVAKIVAQAGYDMLLIETEHVMHDEQDLTNFIMTARDNGLCPLVTVQTTDRAFVSRMLDAGALGIGVCHAETPEQVAQLVRWMKYPPVGERALAFGANTEYRAGDAAVYCPQANAATLLMLKIESRKGLENAEAMMANEWVDAIVFGPGDLAADMGLHGQWEHPDVLAAMDRVIDLAIARGIAVEGLSTLGGPDYERQRERGIQIFGPTRMSEYDMLRDAANRYIAPFR